MSTGIGRADEGRDIEETIDRLEAAAAEVEAVGAGTARTTRELAERLADLIDRYREPATGTGEFNEYIAFQDRLADLLDDVEAVDVHRQGDFERAIGRFDRRILREKDFTRAESDLTDIRELTDAVETVESLRADLERERGRLRTERSRLDSRGATLERRVDALERVDDVDPAPLVEAVEAYNDRIRSEFADFYAEAPAIDVVRVGEKARLFPLADVPPLPDDGAIDVLRETGWASESVATVLEYARYSNSKLNHYVDHPRAVRERIPRTWLEAIDGSDFTVSADTPADVMAHRAPALVSVLTPFAGDATIDDLRQLRTLALGDDYEAMRRARELAHAGDAPADLTAAREELRAVEDERSRIDDTLSRIAAALEESDY